MKDVGRRMMVRRGNILVCSSTSTTLIQHSGVSGERVLSHISVEDGQRPASLDGDTNHKQASGQGPRLECTLLDQAIGIECRLRQWGKTLEEESSRGK